MKARFKFWFGSLVMLTGLLVIAFSNNIVFSGVARLVGIETIIGKDNVVYNADGSYYFTNPRAVVEWVGSAMLLGVLIIVFGAWMSGIRIKFPTKKGKDISN
jgi:hypothetical protein